MRRLNVAVQRRNAARVLGTVLASYRTRRLFFTRTVVRVLTRLLQAGGAGGAGGDGGRPQNPNFNIFRMRCLLFKIAFMM